MAELISQGIKLSYGESSGATTQLHGLKTVPDMGGESDDIDVTNMDDKVKRSTRGLKDPGKIEFGFYYKAGDTDDYAALRALDVAGKTVFFKLEYPDNTGFTFSGKITVIRSAADVNQALQFKLKVSLEGDLEDIA